MSDKDDPVVEALEEAIYQLGGSNYYTRDLEKAIAIQKAQALLIEAVRRDSLWNPFVKEALAALDEVKKG